MELPPVGVRATAGTLRASEAAGSVVLRHIWTEEGVVAGPAANGAQLLSLSVALCVLNDTYREAGRLGTAVDGSAPGCRWRDDRDVRFDAGAVIQPGDPPAAGATRSTN